MILSDGFLESTSGSSGSKTPAREGLQRLVGSQGRERDAIPPTAYTSRVVYRRSRHA